MGFWGFRRFSKERGLRACALTSMHRKVFRSHDVGLVSWITARRLNKLDFVLAFWEGGVERRFGRFGEGY